MIDKETVFVLQHEYEDKTHDDVKFIGVFSSREKAEQAVCLLRKEKGFRDWQDGFCIDEYIIDKIHWLDGFGGIEEWEKMK